MKEKLEVFSEKRSDKLKKMLCLFLCGLLNWLKKA